MVLPACAGVVAQPQCWFCEFVMEMKYRSIDHRPGVSLAAVAILIVISAAALKFLGS
jgi:hypothetical protein